MKTVHFIPVAICLWILAGCSQAVQAPPVDHGLPVVGRARAPLLEAAGGDSTKPFRGLVAHDRMET